MHLDIVLEVCRPFLTPLQPDHPNLHASRQILGHLHPLMLVQVSRASQSFRHLLRSPITDSTWRNSFLVDAQLPCCPSQVSGRRWAKLLFGCHICDECGLPGTNPDYIICRRVCTSCMDPKHVRELHIMVHKALRAGRESSDAEDSDSAIGSPYETRNCHVGLHAVQRFFQSQMAVGSENRNRAERCEAWASTVLRHSRPEYWAKLNKVTVSVMNRLIAEGFDLGDVQEIRYGLKDCDLLWRKPRLTSKLWHQVRPYILPQLLLVRTQRLEYERNWRIRTRKQAILAAVVLTLSTPVTGSLHCYHAPPRAIEEFPPIARLMSEGSEEALTRDAPQLVAALADGAQFVDAWCMEIQTLLVSLLPSVDAKRPDIRLLERATSVFRVQKPGDLATPTPFWTAFGWDEVRTYLDWCSEQPPSYLGSHEMAAFEARGAATAAAIAKLLGLDPDTTTAAQMDAVDARFMCKTCLGVRRQALPWRECVLHDIEKSGSLVALHSIPSWTVLSRLATANVQQREEPEDYSSIPNWACMLCHHHFPGAGTQLHDFMQYHIRNYHDIEHPVEGQHLIYFVGTERPQRRHVTLAVGGEHPMRYRCNRCAEDLPEIVKLFSLRGIRLHVMYRHFVELPGEKDWTEDDLILPAA
ncbi:hypothetical protein DFH09DRAFT_1126198 [Mycena vulgaris]|nr:hypothetical protein DFH09DRAFT_1126198 [Mycena vulgaris]